MFTKETKIFADVGFYLKHKTKNRLGLTIIGDPNDYEELPMTSPLDVQVEGKLVFFCNRMFVVALSKVCYSEIKKSIIKGRYSEDDQIALMLNKDDSEEDMMLFNKMQEWRAFASDVAMLATTQQ